MMNKTYRAAFDLGSGLIKMQSAVVCKESFCIQEVKQIQSIPILLRESIEQDRNLCIPKGCIDELISSMQILLEKASSSQKNFQSIGVGTAPFRVAKNGLEVLQKIEQTTGVKMFCLSPEEEALIGQKSLIAEEKIQVDQPFICWEIGGGSTQISFSSPKGFQSFNKSLGKVPIKHHILKHIQRRKGTSPNPISLEEASLTIKWIQDEFKQAPCWMKNPSIPILGIGAMFSHLKKSVFAQRDLQALLKKYIGKPDEEIPYVHPNYFVSDILFLSAIMQMFNFSKVKYVKLRGPGNTSGILIHKNFWI